MIRAATVADVPAIVTLGAQQIAESAYARVITGDPAQMAATVTHLLAHADATVLIAEDAHGAITGMVGLICFPHHVSGHRTCGEAFLYVDPDARGSVGVRLVKAAETWARAQQAATLQLVAPEGAVRVEALYTALRYVPIERAFMRGL